MRKPFTHFALPRKPTVKWGGGYVVIIPVVGVASSSPGVVAQAFDQVAGGIADGGEAAGAEVDRLAVSTCHA